MTDSATRISAPGTRRALHMHRHAGHHRQHETDGERRRRPVRGGEAADRHHGGEMVEPDDRMAEPDNSPSAKVAGMRPPIT